MTLLYIIFCITDTLGFCTFAWKGIATDASQACLQVELIRSDRPFYVILQESTQTGKWQEKNRLLIDRWSLPRAVELCILGKERGRKVRVLVSGITSSAPTYTIYEGYPWGPPPASPTMRIEGSSPRLLRLYIPTEGSYLLRCYNRVGEEVFTLPIQVAQPKEFLYTLPDQLKGSYLLQIYSIDAHKNLAEKPITL
ncbi:MAG: hypothetical protein NZ580_05585 [Bacteroidia bacterium]|nr:hypothetical protein [Bacteroidia bacterium]MDW8236036.1 hypothetical protein [Bacteroidia bacterium]